MSRSSERSAATPARFFEPRALFILIALALLAFGMLMIFSASSITCLTSEDTNHNPAYYVVRQLVFAGAGMVAAAIIAHFDFHFWSRTLLAIIWVFTIVMLIVVVIAGRNAYGATRWIQIGSFTLQPSEFAKATILLTAANTAQEYFEDGSIDFSGFLVRCGLLVALPLLLVLVQPDKGSVMVCGATLVIMLFLAGAPLSWVLGIAGIGAVGILFLALKDDYSRARITIMRDPWSDYYGDGYQLIQGYYAFGSGGLTGVGLGMSRQKYAYLPMAHNDFIFPVIGEELGLVGTCLVLACFLALVFLGYQIARTAPDLSGTLIAAGASSMLAIQMLVNVLGVIGLMPMTGKPIPFLSYGGSSIISTLILVGLVVSVSRSSSLPRTAYDERRASFRVLDGSLASGGLRVLSGGASTRPDSLRATRDFASSHAGSRVTTNANGSRRIDLGPSASDRLRGRDGGRGRRG